MRFTSYLKDKIIPLLLLFAAVLTVALALCVYAVDPLIIAVTCLVIVMAVFFGILWDYSARLKFYSAIEEAVKNEGHAYFITEFLERPFFAEGRLTYDCLERATKDMNDRIARYRLASEEYQEYVETWIHEVKTPLAAARLIIGNKNDPGLLTLEHELDRTESYLEQALYYARSTAVEKDYTLKEVSLDDLVKTAVKKRSRLLIEQGISPRFEGLATKVYTDVKWLDFVLGQILANAAKYVRPQSEGHQPQLTFSAQRYEAGFENDKVLLIIEDNGVGIPPHDVSRVFEKGFTGENGRRYAKSTGIGLYLCSRLCAQMKLKISLDSTQNEGTTVVIEFPLNKMYFLS